MNQRAYLGGRPTLLDVAKSAVETFVKVRPVYMRMCVSHRRAFAHRVAILIAAVCGYSVQRKGEEGKERETSFSLSLARFVASATGKTTLVVSRIVRLLQLYARAHVCVHVKWKNLSSRYDRDRRRAVVIVTCC